MNFFLEFPDWDWVDDPKVGCGGLDLVSEVVVGRAVVSRDAIFGLLITEFDVSEAAVSEFSFANAVSSGVLLVSLRAN